jgi:hypothetical protein
MSQLYEFKTEWIVEAPLSAVWREIEDSVKWPEWWKGVLEVEIVREGDSRGIGKLVKSVWKSALPYRIAFETEVIRVEDQQLIEVLASGELEGTGVWNFESVETDFTKVVYDWRVITDKAWMNTIAPIAKPLFGWNHDTIMRWGGEGLAKRLDCRVIQ